MTDDRTKRDPVAAPWERGAVHVRPDLTLMVIGGGEVLEVQLDDKQALGLSSALAAAVAAHLPRIAAAA